MDSMFLVHNGIISLARVTTLPGSNVKNVHFGFKANEDENCLMFFFASFYADVIQFLLLLLNDSLQQTVTLLNQLMTRFIRQFSCLFPLPHITSSFLLQASIEELFLG